MLTMLCFCFCFVFLLTELVWKVARYTSAAPMYFTECDNYVDGGVLANNPCIDGLTKIQEFYKERSIEFPVACVVSLGSGICPMQELGSVDFHVFLRLKFSGMFRKAQSLITMLSSAVSVLSVRVCVHVCACAGRPMLQVHCLVVCLDHHAVKCIVVCVCVCMRVCACACACVHAHVCRA